MKTTTDLFWRSDIRNFLSQLRSIDMSDSDKYASQMEKGQVEKGRVAGCSPLSEKGIIGSPTTCSGSTLAESIQHNLGLGKYCIKSSSRAPSISL